MNNLPKSLIPFTKQWTLSWISIILGTILLSGGYVLFINPYKIIPGGVYGLGIIFHHFFHNIQVGTFGLCFDIPLLLLSFKVFGAKSGARTIFAAVLTPIFMNLFTYYIGENPETMLKGTINLSNDILLASIFGGVISGAGLGLIFKSNATSGGTDIVSMIISKYSKLSLSKAIIIVESIIVLIGLIVFKDWKLPLYSIITIFSCVQVIDYILEGASNDKMILIISKEHEKIRDYIINDLERGGTYIKSSGMYTTEAKEMMFVVVNRREVTLVKSFIMEVDENAFTVVVNVHETLGDGFKRFKKSM
ncbi:MAG: YitT family protein [Rikenellaceae bacterium]